MNTHEGIEQSRRDDIESIGYVLVYMLKGTLPWHSIKTRNVKEKHKIIMERKISITPEELVQGFPAEFATFIRYARALKFDEAPNYGYLRGLLEAVRVREGLDLDYNYDWSKVTVKETNTIKIGNRHSRIMNSPDDKATKRESRGRAGRKETGNSMDI